MSHIQIKNTVKRFKDLILDEMEVAGVKCWLAGGCLRDYFSGSYVKTDYDLFFPTQKDYDKALKLFKGTDGWLKWESEKGCKIVRNGKTFDLVKMFFKSPQETIEAFDFTVSMFAVDIDNVYTGETSFLDLAKKQLMINKITYPASTLSRAFRYYQKGFVMCKEEMAKIVFAIRCMQSDQDTQLPKVEGETSSYENTVNIFSGID